MPALYPHHIPISKLQRFLLGSSSTLVSFFNQYRYDMVAVCSETTSCKSLQFMQNKMLESQTGKRILLEKPRINSSTINLENLRNLPSNTMGKHYMSMLEKYNISPDTRTEVRFVDDAELAYVLQRYRETHDFIHLLVDQPANLRGEVAVKWFEAIQTAQPMCWLAATGGTARLSSARRQRLKQDLPRVVEQAKTSEFFMNIYFEERFEQDLDDLRREMKLIK